MSTARDRLYASLDSLVREGTLTAGQADAVYTRAGYSASAGSTEELTSPAGDTSSARDATAEPTGFNLRRLFGAIGVFAAAVVTAGLLITTSLAEDRGFEWKTFLLMVAITLGFAATAIGCHTLVEHGQDPRPTSDTRRGAASGSGLRTTVLTGVLAALTILALAITATSSWDDKKWIGYVSALILLVAGLAGYWFLRRDSLTVVAILGGFALLAQIISDSTSDGGEDASGTILMVGIGFLLYGFGVIAAGWFFSCRNTTGVIGSIIVVGSMHAVVLSLGIVSALGALGDAIAGPTPGGARRTLDEVRGDMWIALILGLVASLAVATLYAWTRHRGYLVVSFIGAALLPVIVTLILARQHPLRWAIGYAVVAGLVIAALVAYQWMRDRFTSRPEGDTAYAGSSSYVATGSGRSATEPTAGHPAQGAPTAQYPAPGAAPTELV